MKDILRKSYDRSAATYNEKFYNLQYEKYKKILHQISGFNTENKLILDHGSGTGLLTNFLKEKGYCTKGIISLDFSMNMLKIAAGANGKLIQGDISYLPFKDNIFKTVFSFTVLNLMEEDETGVLKEIARVLKPGGLFILSILSHKKHNNLITNLENTGFQISNEIPAGQDIGYICYLNCSK